MRRLDQALLLLALPALLGPAVPGSSIGAELIRLRPGFQRIVEIPGARRISVGNPEIVEAQPLPKGDGVLVVGKKEGETDVVVWEGGKRTEWKVEVREPKPSPLEEARAFAAPFPGVSVSENGGSVLFTGTVPTPQDREVFEGYARTRPNVHVRLALPEDRKVLLSYDLKIMEISKGANSQMGVRWPDAIPVGVSLSGGLGTTTVLDVRADFETRINLLMADGRARILANPRLVCESGGSASFLAGGEIPIVLITPETRTVVWKNYGIILKLDPKMDQGDAIRTSITAEISTIDHASGSADVPGFLTRRVTTFFTIPPGGTVMLSGLVKSEMAKDVAKMPLLGQVPILGELFKSRSFRESQSELAVFITPSLAKAGAAEEAALWDAKAAGEESRLKYRLID